MPIIRISKRNTEVSCKKFHLNKKDKFMYMLKVKIRDKVILKFKKNFTIKFLETVIGFLC